MKIGYADPPYVGCCPLTTMSNDKTEGAIRGLERIKADFGMRGANATTVERAIAHLRSQADALAAKDTALSEMRAELERVTQERDALSRRINSPETEDWIAGVPLEAAHQIERWGADHDAGKTAWDWFWLIGYLSQKAAASQTAGDIFKAKHHTISTAAALLNWHRHLTGESTTMRPGIDPIARGIDPTPTPDLGARG